MRLVFLRAWSLKTLKYIPSVLGSFHSRVPCFQFPTMAESSNVLAPALAAMNVDNHSPTDITAARRALSNHLILLEIFDYISMDWQGCWKDRPAKVLCENHGAVTGSMESSGIECCDASNEKRQDHDYTDDDDDDEEDWSVHHYCRGGVLLWCMLVNKLWFEFATPFLWKEPAEMVSYPSYKTAIVAILSCHRAHTAATVRQARRDRLQRRPRQ